jgi:predicted nucleic acid-binding Zn ribbon protein
MVAASGIAGGMLDNGSSVPFYEYRRPDGTILEVMQKMTDPPLTEDPETGVPLQRIFHPIAVHFKGKGFYNTDYGTKKRARENAETKASEKKSEDKKSDAAASDSKAAPKPETAKAESKDSSSSSSSTETSKPKQS